MNGKELLLAFSYIDQEWIEESEESPGNIHAGGKRKQGKIVFRKSLLVAALIGLSLLLVGCTVAYVLNLQGIKIGQQQTAYDSFAYDPETGMPVEYLGKETVTEQVLTLTGLKGTPSYQATQEWFEFVETYDPGDAQWNDYSKFPEEYHPYQAYTQEMVDKVHEIADKYDLKLMGAVNPVHSNDRGYRELGIDGLLLPGAAAQIDMEHGSSYENGNLYIGLFFMEMLEGDGRWPHRMTNSMYYSPKDCFSTFTMTIDDTESWTEWNYKTISGENVLLARNGGLGWIICDREDAILSIRILADGEETMTDRQFEQIADAFDYSIQPKYQGPAASAEGVDPKNPVQTQNGFTMELKSAVSDGQRAIITLGITAPEEVSLNHLQIPGYEEQKPQLHASSFSLECKTGKEDSGWGAGTTYLEDDGDGKENTVNLVIEELKECGDTLAFAPGEPWLLYWEDLQASYWSDESTQMETAWAAEGIWIFDIHFEDTDYRGMELIQQPVSTNVVVGWGFDGEDVYDDVTIKSFILRSLSATVIFEGQSGDLTDYQNQKYVTVMMQDGSAIRLMARNGTAFVAEMPIDLDQVDYVQLVDGTKLYAG